MYTRSPALSAEPPAAPEGSKSGQAQPAPTRSAARPVTTGPRTPANARERSELAFDSHKEQKNYTNPLTVSVHASRGLPGQLQEAEGWYRKSLTIEEELGNRPGMAISHHQLGNIARRLGRLDEAGGWYRKSLAIKEELDDRAGMAPSYHQLGMTAHDRGRLEEAEEWYRKSLIIKEELGDRPGMAVTYHELGITAQARGRLGEAESWYRKSLAISEELGNRRHMAAAKKQLRLLAEARNRPRRFRRRTSGA